jgi:electron transport complex protein RnfC
MQPIPITTINKHENSRKLHNFHGGVHPEQNKHQSTQKPIQTPLLPPRLVLPLQQHIGRAAKACVSPGQQVLKGQVIAEAQGPISVAVHAPTSGMIESIEELPVAHPSGLSAPCIVLTPDGKETWTALTTHQDYLNLDEEQMYAAIQNAGIAGMGGAGFPTKVKLNPSIAGRIDTLVINAIECEPYITSDDMLVREHAEEILRGIEIMARLVEPKNSLVALEDNKPEAYLALREALNERQQQAGAYEHEIELVVVPTKYPSGGEKQLIQILTGKEVPSGGIPADIGVVCQNTGTARAVYRALRFGEPLISRITTLTGKQIADPCNVEALIGTPISWLIGQYGYQPARQERLIMGGPMMGYTITEPDMPLVKTSNCILAPSPQELPMDHQAQACIRCGLCAEACPAELLPQQLYWFSRAQEYEKAEQHSLFDCIECGACSYVCPSSIPLVQYYRHAKGEIQEQAEAHAKSDRARIRFEARQERLDRDVAEKEAKRQARKEAAARAQAARKSADTNLTTHTKTQTSNAEKPPENGPSLETLKANWDSAQTKLDKLFDSLEEANKTNPDMATKLQRAIEKNQLRVNQTKLAYEKAETAASTDQPTVLEKSVTSLPNTDDMKSIWERSQVKLDKMLITLADAKLNNPDTVEKLQRAVDKTQARVTQAKQNYEAVVSTSTATTPSTVKKAQTSLEPSTENDLDSLRAVYEKAQAKLEKMQETLEDARANNSDTIEKFERAVAKNQVRVSAAKTALNAAKARREN